MNWDAVGAIGEVLGGVVVLLSILYLAAQFRQANRHAEASSQSDWTAGWNSAIKGLTQDSKMIEIIRNGLHDFDKLESDEQAKFHMQIAAVQNQWLSAAELRDRDLLAPAIFEGATDVVISIFLTPGGRQFANRNAPMTPRGAELLQLVDQNPWSVPPFTTTFPWWASGGDIRSTT